MKHFIFSIRTRMLFYFGLLFAIILTIILLIGIYGVPFTNFTGEYGQHKDIEFGNLSLIAELKKERLLRWIEERQDNVRVISNSTILNTYLNKLTPLIEKNIYNSSKLRKTIQNETDYQLIQQHLKLVKSSYEIYDKIQIADATSGRIIASTDNEDLGTDVFSQNYFTKALHPANSEIFCIDKDPINNQFKLFLSRKCQPHQNNTRAHAVVIIHVDSHDLINPILNTRSKNGLTGETFLVNEEGKLLTALKYPLENNTIGKVLESEITLPLVTNAATGHEGITITKDYRGEPVLAAYRHLRISPDIGWGLIVKKDQSEIFAGMNKDKIIFLIIGLSGIFLAFILTSIIANSLSKPILHLSQAAKEITEGDWEIRANTFYRGEAGLLASTFNSMIDRIQLHHESLEKQVKLRTQELQKTNDTLITEIKEKKKLTQELEMKNAELERFTYTVSHDLKSPLLTIKGFLGYLEKDIIDGRTEQIQDDIRRIHSAADKMEKLLEELLELSRIGRIVNKHENVSLESLTREVLDLLSSKISPSSIQLILPQNLPVIYVDRIRFFEVMQNLIENALKYMGNQPEPIIEIGAKNEKDHVLCYVKDNGIGIPPRYHDKVFGLFERLDKNTDGTGIGLALVKRIIEVHGGKIWLESKGENQGCTFYFTIPKKGDIANYGHQQS
ncbi:MAG: HAMP domain-containing protein [Candidatus Kuenenia sp.]|nr:HAMP domain-containing protein [Candidatus Kuenenia hertensis]